MSSAGDLNGDGVDDVVISSGCCNARFGVSVVFGRDTAQVGNFPAVFQLSSLLAANGGDGSAGFLLKQLASSDSAGRSLSSAGDVNGDGIDDLIIGAQGADPGGRSRAGESYVVFGRDTAAVGNFPAELELASLLAANGGDGRAGFVLFGAEAGDQSGYSVSAAGDVNADGLTDLVIGALHASPGGRADAGVSYVVFGRQADDFDDDGVSDALDNCLLIANTNQRDSNDDGYGNACDPDLNGDGIVNAAILHCSRTCSFPPIPMQTSTVTARSPSSTSPR